jgi:hypothetical protein
MKSIPFILLLLFSACDLDEEPVSLDLNTFTIRVLDENNRLVYDGKGEAYYYGGEHIAFSMPQSTIPVPDSLNFMVVFMTLTGDDQFKEAFLSERYYSLPDDFGFHSSLGIFQFKRETSEWKEGSFHTVMRSGPAGDLATNPHPVWGSKIIVSGEFKVSTIH